MTPGLGDTSTNTQTSPFGLIICTFLSERLELKTSVYVKQPHYSAPRSSTVQIVLTYPMTGILFAFACQVLSSAASLLPFHNHPQLPLTKRDSSEVSQMWQLLPWV